MTNRLNKLLIFVLCLLGFAQQSAAQPEFNYEELKKKYPGQNGCVLNQSQHLFIDLNKGKIKIHSEEELDILLFTDRAAQQAEKSIYYSGKFSDIKDIKAKTWIPSGNKLKSIDVEKINERNPVSDGVFYDDVKEKYFLFPSLQPGAVSSLRYTKETYDPHFINPFYFGLYIPAIKSEFKVTFPENVKVKYVLQDKNKVVKVSEEKRKKEITYTFTATSVEGFPDEENSQELAYYAPHIIVYIDSYEDDDKVIPVLSNVNELYAWYRSLYEQVDNVPNKELKTFADSLVAGKKSDDEKIKTIFYWVQDNIKYIAFEDGLGGFIPRNPNDIFRKRYGDCKDKSVLMNLLLRNAGFEAYPAWIGTRDIPYSYNQVPTPAVDNHMISALRKDNKWIFLDGTSYFLPYKIPTSMIQDKEALVGISKDSFQLVRVEEMPSEYSTLNNRYNLSIENDKLNGTGISSIEGYPQQLTVVGIQRLSTQKRLEFLEKSLDIGTNKYKASDLKLFNLESRDSALKYSFNFVLSDYVSIADDNIYVNLNLNKPLHDEKINIEKRKTDRTFDYKFVQSMQSTLKVPLNYQLSALPSDLNFENEFFGCSFKYIKDKESVTLSSKVWINTLLIKKDQFTVWNDFMKQLSKAYGELIILKKI